MFSYIIFLTAQKSSTGSFVETAIYRNVDISQSTSMEPLPLIAHLSYGATDEQVIGAQLETSKDSTLWIYE